MKAIVFENFGGPEKLHLADVPTPRAEKGEVVVGVHYAAVNPVDYKIREGYLKERVPHVFPIIPGWDVSGEITEVGEGVTDWKVGDKVYSYARKPTVQFGTYAEYVALEAANIAAAPKKASLAEAASIPLVALTAWQALFDIAGLKKGQSVLVHAGAGGVGGTAIQLAKHCGAEVITTASLRNHGYVRELGASLPIDYTQESVVDVINAKYPKGVDVIFDCAGGLALQESYGLVREGGCLVSIVEVPDSEKAPKIRTAYHFVTPNGAQLKTLAGLVDSGELRPLPLEVLPLDHAPEAQEKSRSRHQRGKIVLKVR